VDAHVAADERGQAGHVLVPDGVALAPELADGGVQVDGGPQHDAVQRQSEGAELVLQAALVPVVQLVDPADIAPLLAGAGGGRFLITSRRATGWHSLGGEDESVGALADGPVDRVGGARCKGAPDESGAKCPQGSRGSDCGLVWPLP